MLSLHTPPTLLLQGLGLLVDPWCKLHILWHCWWQGNWVGQKMECLSLLEKLWKLQFHFRFDLLFHQNTSSMILLQSPWCLHPKSLLRSLQLLLVNNGLGDRQLLSPSQIFDVFICFKRMKKIFYEESFTHNLNLWNMIYKKQTQTQSFSIFFFISKICLY